MTVAMPFVHGIEECSTLAATPSAKAGQYRGSRTREANLPSCFGHLIIGVVSICCCRACHTPEALRPRHAKDGTRCPQQESDVQPETPFVDVLDIHLDPLVERDV